MSQQLHNLLNSIQDKAEKETRDVHTLFEEVKNIAGTVYVTGTFTESAVITLCSDLIKLYELRCPK